MEKCVHDLYPRNGQTNFLGQFDWRAKECFHFHRSLILKVLVHDRVFVGWLNHFCHRLFPEIRCKCAAVALSKSKQLINDVRDHIPNASHLKELSVIWTFEYDTGRVECNWSVDKVSFDIILTCFDVN